MCFIFPFQPLLWKPQTPQGCHYPRPEARTRRLRPSSGPALPSGPAPTRKPAHAPWPPPPAACAPAQRGAGADLRTLRSCRRSAEPQMEPPPGAAENSKLRHVEKDVLIPQIMRERAKELCSDKVQGIFTMAGRTVFSPMHLLSAVKKLVFLWWSSVGKRTQH
ncbi:COX assembly mitochondrial protein homolog isoform 3-T6 [Alca torda]